MKGKTVIVTGANSGLGKATAAALAAQGATVIIACRSAERGEQARQEISEATGSGLVQLMQLDLADLESVRGFAGQFSSRHKRLDVLINNAGLMVATRRVSNDGYELQFAVNHLGHFLLTALLFDTIRKSGDGRIINVTSSAHRLGRIDFDNLMLEKGYHPFRAYARTKLANVLFTYALARRTGSLAVSANCVHPGIIATPFILNRRDNTAKRLLMKFENLVFRSPEKAAETIVRLASESDHNGNSGLYWAKNKALRSGRRSYDKEAAERLWKVSEELCGCRFEIKDMHPF
ncbi:MAG: SDR family oxidoreductase [Spirochaetales bacterium]|nr:SDR family oxidoreductase [Spirochaetales bacterium]